MVRSLGEDVRGGVDDPGVEIDEGVEIDGQGGLPERIDK
jgi:hypothetical protein